MCEYIYNIDIKLTMYEYFFTYIITCIFELNSILLLLSFMIEILQISNKFIKLLLLLEL
jgi:hypothetical protein